MKKKPKKQINRKHKDRLFQFVFQNRRDLLELYNAINGTEYGDPDELMITTLEDAVFLGMKNDLSFVIGATMNLYEHQSTWNSNMPLRGLFYFSNLYQNYIEQNGLNLYGSKRIELPFPNYLVFYNGDTEVPEQTELSLEDAFSCSDKEIRPCLDCRVKVLNINQGHNQELLKKCRRLWEYAEFIGEIKRNLEKERAIDMAICQAMDTCKEQGILTDILSRCQTEVFRMLLAEYDEKKVRAYLQKEARDIGSDMVNRLNCLLIEDGRLEELKKASQDKNYQKQLFLEYGIKGDEDWV